MPKALKLSGSNPINGGNGGAGGVYSILSGTSPGSTGASGGVGGVGGTQGKAARRETAERVDMELRCSYSPPFRKIQMWQKGVSRHVADRNAVADRQSDRPWHKPALDGTGA